MSTAAPQSRGSSATRRPGGRYDPGTGGARFPVDTQPINRANQASGATVSPEQPCYLPSRAPVLPGRTPADGMESCVSVRVIALGGHKGGIGKSTTAVNLAAGLAGRGKRTLLVDADAQGDATFMFVEDPDAIEYDLRDVIVGRGHGAIPIAKAIRPTRVPLLDILPATLDLARLDTELVSMTSGEIRVARALEPVLDTYEFVIVDQHASLSTLNVACLAAASRSSPPPCSASSSRSTSPGPASAARSSRHSTAGCPSSRPASRCGSPPRTRWARGWSPGTRGPTAT